MSIYNSITYRKDIENAIGSVVNIEFLMDSSILVAGAAGLIGSYIVDILLEYNRLHSGNITIYAMDRSAERLAARFGDVKTDKLIYIEHDINQTLDLDCTTDFIIHAASNAFPAAFNSDPVGTIMSNILGTKLLLDYASSHGCRKFLYISSGEVYGQGDLSLEAFEESYSGYVDPCQARSCYPSSKRTAETLCVSYAKQFGLDTVCVRPCHTYGPNATAADNRANVQFINSAMNGEDIVLNSAGTQLRSYCYIADTACAIVSVLTSGTTGEAYNIAYSKSRVTIAQFAGIVASQTGRRLIFADPDAVALAERTPIAKQVLNAEKLEATGWQGHYTAEDGIAHTLAVLRESSVK